MNVNIHTDLHVHICAHARTTHMYTAHMCANIRAVCEESYHVIRKMEALIAGLFPESPLIYHTHTKTHSRI